MVRPTLNLEDHKALVMNSIANGHSHETIRRLLQQHDVHISIITLRRRISRWSVSKRPAVADLEPHKELVTTSIASGSSHQDVLQMLRSKGISISIATLNRRLATWSVRSPRVDTEDPELRAAIAHHFNVLQITDEASARLLSDAGFAISKRTVQKLRCDMGLLKRILDKSKLARELHNTRP
nr:hypothetical protein CFP56_30752 [Quercus suber]POE72818.1 hypothetical protein CFP56_30757 [Quercus suber]